MTGDTSCHHLAEVAFVKFLILVTAVFCLSIPYSGSHYLHVSSEELFHCPEGRVFFVWEIYILLHLFIYSFIHLYQCRPWLFMLYLGLSSNTTLFLLLRLLQHWPLETLSVGYCVYLSYPDLSTSRLSVTSRCFRFVLFCPSSRSIISPRIPDSLYCWIC